MNASITAETAGSFSKMLALTTSQSFHLRPLSYSVVLTVLWGLFILTMNLCLRGQRPPLKQPPKHKFMPRLCNTVIRKGVELCVQY